MSTIQIDRYSLEIERTCHDCGSRYCLADMIDAHEADFLKPVRYIDGCEQYCLACWLGVGPKDVVTDGTSPTHVPEDRISALHVDAPYQELRDGSFHVKLRAYCWKATLPKPTAGFLMKAGTLPSSQSRGSRSSIQYSSQTAGPSIRNRSCSSIRSR